MCLSILFNFKCLFVILSQDMGTIVLGKLESGVISKGLMLMMMPNKVGIGLYLSISCWEISTVSYVGGHFKSFKLKKRS